MTTKNAIIAQAFEEIGMAEYIFDATPEELQSFLRRLDGMAAEWDGIGIRVGYDLGGDINSQAGIPDTAVNCFATNLGVRMAPGFGKTVSIETKVAAKNAFNSMLVARRVIPEVPFPSMMPIGTGNRRDVLDQQYYPTANEVSGVNEGPLEY